MTQAARGKLPAGSRRQKDGLLEELVATVGSRREAKWILEHVADDAGLEDAARETAARALGERRAAGEPLQYVLGRWPFRSVELEVDRRVLVPRPETEQVVEVALGRLSRTLADPRRPRGPALCCDLGTGSGAIACAIAAEAPIPPGGLVVWATDRSPEALAVARSNRERLRAGGSLRSAVIEIAEGDWYAALPEQLAGRFDLVVCNPPYVSAAEHERLDHSVRDHEPVAALVAADGRDGTPGAADVEWVLLGATAWLRRGGSAVVEIAPHQAEAAARVARTVGFAEVAVEADLGGLPRMVVAAC